MSETSTEKASMENELVISYAVFGTGIIDKSREEYQRLQEALKLGCVVVDITSVSVSAGNVPGFAVITVLLRKPNASTPPAYKKY